MIRLRYLAVALALFTLQACTEAKFQGGAANQPSAEELVSFNCELASASIEAGKAQQIAITASDAFDGPVFQSVVNGESKIESTLNYKDGSYKKEDGSENLVTVETEGKYTVELRSIADGPVKGSCEYQATAKTTEEEPAPKCEENQELVGANVAFLVDNSFSHATTDCAGFDRNRWNSERKAYCTLPTNREKAVLEAFDTLNKLAQDNEYSERSKSHLAIASFPTKEDTIGGGAIHTNDGWIESTQEGRSSLEAGLRFSREPIGYTPYGAGLAQAKKLFGDNSGSSDGKAKVAVLVTDGEPTDRNPQATKELAKDLEDMGVKLITVYVLDGKTREQRRADHISFLERENAEWQQNSNQTWFDRDDFGSFDGYLTELLGDNSGQISMTAAITSKKDADCQDENNGICARNVVEVNNSEALMTTFKNLAQQATSCE